jgi:hypothetical protein
VIGDKDGKTTPSERKVAKRQKVQERSVRGRRRIPAASVVNAAAKLRATDGGTAQRSPVLAGTRWFLHTSQYGKSDPLAPHYPKIRFSKSLTEELRCGQILQLPRRR